MEFDFGAWGIGLITGLAVGVLGHYLVAAYR